MNEDLEIFESAGEWTKRTLPAFLTVTHGVATSVGEMVAHDTFSPDTE